MTEKNKRHEELGDKIFEMGFALHEEGAKKNDYTILSIGDIMLLISSIIHDIEDVKLFTDICAMFSAKKIVDSKIDISEAIPKSKEEIEDMLRSFKSKIDLIDEDDDEDDEDDLNSDLGTN